MKFGIQRAGKSAAAALAIALINPAVSSVAYAQATDQAAGQQPAGGQPPAAGGAPGQAPAGQKNWKDRAEYDLYVKLGQTQDPKARLELLNTWQDKYPTTDYSKERTQFFLSTYGQLAGTDPTARQKLLDYCKQTLDKDPKDFTALYLTTAFGPMVGGATPSPELLTQVESAAKGVIQEADTKFAASAKPASTSEADWTKAKGQAVGTANRTLIWAAKAEKDPAATEAAYKSALQADPNNGVISYEFGQSLLAEKKYPEALFQYARAASYDGPGSIPADKRPALLAYFNKVYAQFHGSPDGADKILEQAKGSALPPDGFQIEGGAELAKKQADEMQKRIDSDPGFKVWYSIQQQLTGDGGDAFFKNVKGAEIPGTAVPSKNFTGTVISIDPPDKPTKVVLGVTDPTKPDATLVWDEPVDATGLKVGDKMDFAGTGDSYTKEPYMLTLKDATSPSIKGKPKTGVRKRTGR